MTKYILVYRAYEANDWTKLPKDEVQKLVNAWGVWVGAIGGSRKDGGAFKFGGKSATKDGPKDADNTLTGYAIVEFENFDQAMEAAQKAPIVQDGTGTIEVYEAFAVN